ncbi:hypothetical protein A6M13_11035 [Caryophanon tenue]|uniref:Uncharacterized protein n=1 Tax=Caryophanon tenue TaxID=33978 RepID=A0A1C0YJA4_9BACL|nr:hypothetical protein A6M13_11035 [Caryophanon tenue]
MYIMKMSLFLIRNTFHKKFLVGVMKHPRNVPLSIDLKGTGGVIHSIIEKPLLLLPNNVIKH